MKLSLSAHAGEKIITNLAQSLMFGSEIAVSEIDDLRAEAFESTTLEGFRYPYLRSEVFSKWAENSEIDLDAVAIRAFKQTERELNVVTRWLVAPKWNWVIDDQRLSKARAIVSRILGPFCLNELEQSCEWSSGASTEFKRRTSQIENKWVLSTHLTAGIQSYHEAFVKASPWPEIRRETCLVPGNRITTVPKSYKTNRVIAIEPSWNMFFQKGIGTMIRKRLRRFGQLLPDAQERARNFAKLGSSSGLLATLDLKAASDSISVALCERLLPPDWLTHVLNTRSQVGMVDGEVFPYCKISSMGNGYTFELETLFFYALACSYAGIGNKWTHVYGDDIIISSDLAMPLAETLAEVGFDLNMEKSFWRGPFRESCGGHYWNGHDVTPFYAKGYPKHVGDVVVLHNKVLNWLCTGGRERDEFAPFLSSCRRLTPRKFWGPMYSDGTLWTHWDSATPSWHRDYQCWKLHRLVKLPVRCDESSETYELGSYLQSLWKERSDWHPEEAVPAVFRWKAVSFYVDRGRWIDPTV